MPPRAVDVVRLPLVVLLLAGVAFAGCSGSPTDEPATGDDPRRSVGQDDGEAGAHDDVVLLQVTLDLVGEDSQEHDVVVPDNVTRVRFTLQSPDPSVFTSFRVELSGCGAYMQEPGFSSGTVSMAHEVCGKAAAGPAVLTISNTGVAQGNTLNLIGEVPRANATAPA
jgi:hypothetical protein